MKKSILSISVAVFATLFFASCSSEKGVTIEKRHYGKGYYVHVSGSSKDELSVKQESAVALIAPSKEAPVELETKKASVAEVLPTIKPATHSQNLLNHHSTDSKSLIKKEISRVEKSTVQSKQQAIAPVNKSDNSPMGGGDVNTILLIVLCFFLPPLAVFLSDGGLTTNFWIDLILCLLFWIPGVVFAFIVCFA